MFFISPLERAFLSFPLGEAVVYEKFKNKNNSRRRLVRCLQGVISEIKYLGMSLV